MEKISIARRRWEKENHEHEHTDGSPCLFGKRPDYISSCPPLPDADPADRILDRLKILGLGENRFSIEITQGSDVALRLIASISPADHPVPEKRFLTPDEAAKLYRVNKKVIYRELKKGTLKGFKVGKQWRILLDPNGAATTKGRV